MESLPVRERGLKPFFWNRTTCKRWSLPVRERGLKLNCRRAGDLIPEVAPRAGAWIEADVQSQSELAYQVAPRAGAWIEAPRSMRGQGLLRSLPVRERGFILSGAQPRHAAATGTCCSDLSIALF